MTIAYMVAAHSRALGFGFPLPLVRIVSNRSTAPLTDARMPIMSPSLNLAPDALTTGITPRTRGAIAAHPHRNRYGRHPEGFPLAKDVIITLPILPGLRREEQERVVSILART